MRRWNERPTGEAPAGPLLLAAALGLALLPSACAVPDAPPDAAPAASAAATVDPAAPVMVVGPTAVPGEAPAADEGAPASVGPAGGEAAIQPVYPVTATGAAPPIGAPPSGAVVTLSEPTVKGLALFVTDAVRPYAADITEAASLRDALTQSPRLFQDPAWLGRAARVAERTKIVAQTLDVGLRGGRWTDDARPLVDALDGNVVVPLFTSATAFLGAVQAGDAAAGRDALEGMTRAVDSLAVSMQLLRDELLTREAPATAED